MPFKADVLAAAQPPTKGKQLLNELTARVKQEGELNIAEID